MIDKRIVPTIPVNDDGRPRVTVHTDPIGWRYWESEAVRYCVGRFAVSLNAHVASIKVLETLDGSNYIAARPPDYDYARDVTNSFQDLLNLGNLNLYGNRQDAETILALIVSGYEVGWLS